MGEHIVVGVPGFYDVVIDMRPPYGRWHLMRAARGADLPKGVYRVDVPFDENGLIPPKFWALKRLGWD